MPRLPWIRRRPVPVVQTGPPTAPPRVETPMAPETAVPIPAAMPSPLTPDEARWAAQRRRVMLQQMGMLPTNIVSRAIVLRPFLVNSCTPYLPIETMVETGLLPGMAEPERPRQIEPTQSSTPTIKSLLPERWTIEESCPKRRIILEE